MQQHFEYVVGGLIGSLLLLSVFSILIGVAYRERSLWCLAVTNFLGLVGLFYAPMQFLHGISTALALLILVLVAGQSGLARQPVIALKVTVVIGLVSTPINTYINPPDGVRIGLTIAYAALWFGAVFWYFKRLWLRISPWGIWLALGQFFLYGGFLLSDWAEPIVSVEFGLTLGQSHQLWMTAHLAMFSVASYLALVWRSRQVSEAGLRASDRGTLDPLTGCLTSAVFIKTLNDSALRSANLEYRAGILLVSGTNLQEFSRAMGAGNNEIGLLWGSQLIRRAIRSHDAAGRLSNDIFAVLIDGLDTRHTLTAVATRILAGGLRAKDANIEAEPLKLRC